MALDAIKLKVVPTKTDNCIVKIYFRHAGGWFELREEKKLKTIKSAVSWAKRISKVYAREYATVPAYVTDDVDKVAYVYIEADDDVEPKMMVPKKTTILK